MRTLLLALALSLNLALTLSLAGPARGGEALLAAGDMVATGRLGWIAPGFALPALDLARPTVDPAARDPAAAQLRGLAAYRRAAGFEGVLYDNRDRGHSDLPAEIFPRLTRLVYAPELVAAGLDYGLGGAVLLPAMVIGNSSTALVDGPAPRSLPRLAMTTEDGPARAFRTYVANHLYVYPEHHDHDAADLYPANWPYMVVSQGSSGSDQALLRALFLTLAAFPPDTRARLQRDGLVAPTLQMILRRTLAQVAAPEDYLTGAAHPSAFTEAMLRPARMVAMAAAMRPETVPPLVRLTVVSEDFAAEAGLGGLSERLFDTPAAIARIFRGPDWEKSLTVAATATGAAPGAAPGAGVGADDDALRFTWALLRGDPERVRIEPLDPAGRTARITVAWHDVVAAAGRTEEGAPRLTSRVDVGVFAETGPGLGAGFGAGFGAPAFVSIDFPAHEARRYAAGPDGAMRLASVDYDALGRGATYDPMLHWSAPWRDVFDESGGWRRERRDGSSEAFDAQHRRVGPAGAAAVSYRIDRQDRTPILVETTGSD